jgi:hypothetical protein
MDSTALSRRPATDLGAIPESITPVETVTRDWEAKVSEAARAKAPEAWSKRDLLLDQQAKLRQSLEAELGDPRAAISDIDAKISYARDQLFNAPYGKRKTYQAALNDLYRQRDTAGRPILLGQEPARAADIRRQLQAVDYQLRDVAPEISASLRHGESVVPKPAAPEPFRLPEDISGPTPFDRAMQETGDQKRIARTLDTVAPEALKTAPEILAKADQAIGKPQTFSEAGTKEQAADHGINPESGEFEELADLKRLADSEQLTKAETEALKEADATVKRTEVYAKAFKAAAMCMGRA